jgi:hypothetical protein
MTSTEQLQIVKDNIIEIMNEQEKSLMNLRETLDRRGVPSNRQNRDVSYRMDKLHGMMDICDKLGIDRSSYNWIFKV